MTGVQTCALPISSLQNILGKEELPFPLVVYAPRSGDVSPRQCFGQPLVEFIHKLREIYFYLRLSAFAPASDRSEPVPIPAVPGAKIFRCKRFHFLSPSFQAENKIRGQIRSPIAPAATIPPISQ